MEGGLKVQSAFDIQVQLYHQDNLGPLGSCMATHTHGPVSFRSYFVLHGVLFSAIFISKYHQQGKALPINTTNGTRKKKKM